MRNVYISKWLRIMLLIIVGFILHGCCQQTSAEDSDFTNFKRNDSDFFTIARAVMPWNEGNSGDANMIYFHKRMSDGREYAQIKVLFSAQSQKEVKEIAENKAKVFVQTHVNKSPYFCIEEESFQLNGINFWCYTFSVSESNRKQSCYYGYAIGYNENENSIVYLLFSDEELSYSEPDWLLSKFYP